MRLVMQLALKSVTGILLLCVRLGSVLRQRIPSALMRLSILQNRFVDRYFPEHELYHNPFAKNYQLEGILGRDTDGPFLLVGVTDHNYIVRAQSTKKQKELGNILINCRTRGGKGILAKPQILGWPESVIALDLKGDFDHDTGAWREKLGRRFVFDPTGYGHRFDPFRGKESEDALKNIATNLLYRPDEGKNEIFTIRGITMLLQLFPAARLEKQSILQYVRYLVYSGPIDTAKRLQALSVQHNLFPNLATRFLDMSLADMMKRNFKDDFFLSCWGTMTHRMDPFFSDLVMRSLYGSDFTAQDIIQGEKPATLYLRWPEDSILTLAPLLRLVWCSLISDMMHIYDKAEDKRTCRPVLAILDEAGRLAIPMMSEYVVTAAGRGISFWMAFQSPSQLDAVYGAKGAEIIRDNMDTQIFYRPPNFKVAREMSDALGEISKYAKSTALRHGEETSESRSERPVALLTPQQIRMLDNEEIIAYHANYPPMKLQRIDIRNFPELMRRTDKRPTPTPVLPQVSMTIPDLTPSIPVETEEQRQPVFVNPEQYMR